MSSQFIHLSNIDTFQVDHNSTCNLACPQCARTVSGEVNKELPLKYLPLEFYKKVFTQDLCQKINRVFFCGNYGDVIASPNIIDVVTYLKNSGLKTLSIVTNGSLRSPEWWAQLAKVMTGPTDKVLFSIDGLHDTNHIYRVGSRFEKIMENATAFIKAGGRARWEYLVFAHNEHQVEEAKTLAKEMGFEGFKMKKTNRFINDKNYKSGKKETQFEVKGKAQKFTQALNAPEKKEYQTKSMNRFESIISKYGSWESYVNSAKINCKAQKDRSLFIDFQGDLWPCTWMAAPPYFHGDNNFQKKHLLKIIDHYGKGFNNLFKKNLEEVLDHPWFRRELTESWCKKTTDSPPKPMTCGRTCGQEYEFSSNAEENKVLTRFS